MAIALLANLLSALWPERLKIRAGLISAQHKDTCQFKAGTIVINFAAGTQ